VALPKPCRPREFHPLGSDLRAILDGNRELLEHLPNLSRFRPERGLAAGFVCEPLEERLPADDPIPIV